MFNQSKTIAIILFLIMTAAPLGAQRDITGQEWKGWQPGRRISYLVGFYAGLKADRAVFNQAEKTPYRNEPGGIDPLVAGRYKLERDEYYAADIKYNFKDMAKRIDVFYSDEDNLGIPVPEVLRIIMLRAERETQRAEFLLLRERRKSLEGR